jgi:hypothetical protein
MKSPGPKPARAGPARAERAHGRPRAQLCTEDPVFLNNLKWGCSTIQLSH